LNSVFERKGKGWIRRLIGDVATTQYGLSGTLNTEGKGYKIFRMGEVQNGLMVDTGAMKYIEIDGPEFGQYRLSKNDVLFNRTNSSDLVGKTGLFNMEGDYCFASYLVRVKFDQSKISSRFAAYLMNTTGFLARIRAKAARSVNQANINATILRNEPIDFPENVATQEQLVKQFEDLARETNLLADSYRRRLSELTDLKQAILQKAFSGDFSVPPAAALKAAAE
jgi:restriction endonuclease S subunit